MKNNIKICLIVLTVLLSVLCLASCSIFSSCEHEWVEATCTTPKTCKICKDTKGEANGHAWIDAKCNSPKVCSVCTLAEGDPLGHDYGDDNICTRCQHKLEMQFTFKLNSTNSGYVLYSKGSFVDKHVTIPEKYYNLPVMGIYENAFMGCTELESIFIPATVQAIGPNVFKNCTSLKKVEWEDKSRMSSIAAGAFANCTSLQEITLPDSLDEIGSGAFSGCVSLKKISVPFIGNGRTAQKVLPSSDPRTAFGFIFGSEEQKGFYRVSLYGYNGSSQFYLPIALNEVIVTGGTVIDESFANCINIYKLTIGKDVTDFSYSAIVSCYKLMEICNLSSFDISKKELNETYSLEVQSVYTEEKNQDNVLKEDDFVFYLNNETNDYILLDYLGSSTVLRLPQEIKGNTYSIISYAFYNNNSVNTVFLSTGVEKVGKQLFSSSSLFGSRVITNLYVPNIDHYVNIEFSGMNPFLLDETSNVYVNEELVNTVSFSAEVTEIKPYVFSGWCKLRGVQLPQNSALTTIGAYAFYNCDMLISFPFENCNQLTYIQAYAFYSSGLQEVTLPESVQQVEEYAFRNCNNLKYNDYNGGNYIGTATNPYFLLAGINDSSITHLTINSNTVILSVVIPSPRGGGGWGGGNGESNFRISSIFIPESVRYIADYTFEKTSRLTSVYVPNLESWFQITFGGIYATPFRTASFFYCDGVAVDSLTVPSTVTQINDYAFFNATFLTDLVFEGNQITTIGNYAFAGCSSLTAVTIPASVTEIGIGAFEGCTSLDSLTFAETDGWYVQFENDSTANIDLTDSSRNVAYLSSKNYYGIWKRS